MKNMPCTTLLTGQKYRWKAGISSLSSFFFFFQGCNFTTVNHYKLKEHCRSHTREKIFACVTCGGMFANKTKLVDHMVRQNSSGCE